MDKNKHAKQLLDRYLKDQCTPEEKALVEEVYAVQLESTEDEFQYDLDYTAKEMEIWDAVHLNRKTKVVRLWPRLTAAAAILIFAVLAFLWAVNPAEPDLRIAGVNPGINKATLTLSNGRRIDLVAANNGALAEEGSASIRKNHKGLISYAADKSGTRPEAPVYNTLTTPNGGYYTLTLADGTNVWLNATSSIKYPTVFSGGSRQVEITGEAYFEVAHDAARPFTVIAGDQKVEVLGTHFNINSYASEPGIKTTLLQGSVRVTYQGREQMLKPGQQSAIKNNNISVYDVETDDVIAWKNGYFEFSNTDIQSAMRQISRWYNVEVQYEGPVTTETLTGRISRLRDISEVLKMIQQTKIVNLKVEGRRIMVKE
ncbi:FecR domain-containing protein [Mucilaginibacter sp. ZT4R22]|uniref:FecR domain-containing protein n=1 Tax=Mucilaginibacter pankratovii TaxID=2772110 RepID=A0ABR7WWD6_9SPHI|nr:FecR domain-containing protein [Mucilaginibacter pankratovii]MBD1366597.1 FecR domain-containing protein [Mucilaginibacter pankratovii]